MLNFVGTQRSPGQKAEAITKLKVAPTTVLGSFKNELSSSAIAATALKEGAMPMTKVRDSIARNEKLNASLTASGIKNFGAIGRHHKISIILVLLI